MTQSTDTKVYWDNGLHFLYLPWQPSVVSSFPPATTQIVFYLQQQHVANIYEAGS